MGGAVRKATTTSMGLHGPETCYVRASATLECKEAMGLAKGALPATTCDAVSRTPGSHASGGHTHPVNVLATLLLLLALHCSHCMSQSLYPHCGKPYSFSVRHLPVEQEKV